jgi:hypothetical protein
VSGSTTWSDLSGNNNSGSLATSGSGAVSASFNSTDQGSIQLNGNALSGSYISLRSGSGIDVGSFFTVQTWVKIDRFGGNVSGPVWSRASIISNSYPYSSNQGFWICCTSQSGSSLAAGAGYEAFFISMGSDQYVAGSQTGSLSNYVGKWVNLAARVSGSALIRLYINGAEISSYGFQTVGPSTLSYNTRPCSLGIRDNNNQEFLSGSIAGLTMYNRALSDQEIAQNYNALKSRFGLT